MSIVSLPTFSIGCFVCGKKMMAWRKYADFCTIKCQRKGNTRLHQLLDEAYSNPIVNSNIKVASPPHP